MGRHVPIYGKEVSHDYLRSGHHVEVSPGTIKNLREVVEHQVYIHLIFEEFYVIVEDLSHL